MYINVYNNGQHISFTTLEQFIADNDNDADLIELLKPLETESHVMFNMIGSGIWHIIEEVPFPIYDEI